MDVHGPKNAGQDSHADGATAKPANTSVATERLSTSRGFPELSELVLACRHHLLITASLGVVVSSGLIALAWWLIGANYEAESLVRVRQHQDVVFTPQTSRSDDAAFVRAQEQLVLSPQVLGAALRGEQVKPLAHLIPANDASEWLKKRLRVNVQPGAECMSISAIHPSPQVAQVLSVAVTHAYLKEVSNRLATDLQRRTEELQRAARNADARLDELWAKLNSVANQVGSDNSQSLTIRDEIRLQAYRDYAQQLRAAQLRGNALQSMLTEEQMRTAVDENAIENATDAMLNDHPDIVVARNQIAQTDSQIQQTLAVVAQDDSPRLKRLYEDREYLQAALVRLKSELRPKIDEQNRINLENNLVQLRKQIEVNQAEKEFLHSRMAEIDTDIVRADKTSGVRLEMSRHAVDRQTHLADSLWRSLEELKIESQSQPRVALTELAPLPLNANHGRQLKAAAGAAAVGWMIVILGIGFLEWQGCHVRDVDDLKSHSAYPVFGANPSSKNLARTRNADRCSGASEAAARLMLANQNGDPIPTIMITSASAGEPRHLVALDLARAFRSFRRRTLLIDCDTSGPLLSQQAAADHLPGVIQVCRDGTNPGQTIIPSSEDGLDFLPLGRGQDDESWIDPSHFPSLLKSLRANYDVIVVNGPAMMSSAECLLLASQVEQTLLAVFKGSSRWNQLVESEQVARQAGIAIFGSVLHSGKRSAVLNLRHELRGEPGDMNSESLNLEERRSDPCEQTRRPKKVCNRTLPPSNETCAKPRLTRPSCNSSPPPTGKSRHEPIVRRSRSVRAALGHDTVPTILSTRIDCTWESRSQDPG